jgi:hypothetical protein
MEACSRHLPKLRPLSVKPLIASRAPDLVGQRQHDEAEDNPADRQDADPMRAYVEPSNRDECKHQKDKPH